MDKHTKLSPTDTPPVVGYQLPPRFFLNSPDRPDRLSAGDREALSTLIAAYSFTPRIYDLMRFITAANSTIQGYLVKRNRYSDYIEIFRDISDHIAYARILLDSPRDHGRAATILYSLEIALKIIAEREGLTQTGATMYEGRMPITPAAPSDPDLQEDPQEDPYGI